VFAYATAGDPGPLPFGLDMVDLQTGALAYAALSGLVFVIIWVVGYLRR
jgi:hypothetical protein